MANAKIESIINRIKNIFYLSPFDCFHMRNFDRMLKQEILHMCPNIYDFVSVNGNEIHIDERFYNSGNSDVISYIPILFEIK